MPDRFDATGISLRDRERPVEQRSTTTLIRDIKSHLMVAPAFFTAPEERAYAVTSSYRELRRRGIDAELVIRCGLATSVSWGMLISLLGTEFLASAGLTDGEEAQAFPEADPGWRALLDAAREADGATAVPVVDYATSQFSRRLRDWIAAAPLEDYVTWRPPSVDVFLNVPPADWSKDDLALSHWLVERFIETYLEEWSIDALELEWGYLHGEQPGCCPADAMRERRTNAIDVARALADRHHENWKRRPRSKEDRRFSANDFTRAAAENLMAGRLNEAAAIFAAVLKLSPESVEANNNYGFCILPTDPVRALAHLEKAAATGAGNVVEMVNSANRVLALHLLGRDGDALDLADHSLNIPMEHSTPAYLWSHGVDQLKLVGPADPRTHLEQLRDHLAGGPRWESCKAS